LAATGGNAPDAGFCHYPGACLSRYDASPDAGAKPNPAALSDIESNPMKPVREGRKALGCFSALLLLSGCGGPEPECGASDTRNSIVKIVSDDHNNALVNYAAKNSNAVATMMADAKSEADKVAILEKARADAVYVLDKTVRMKSINKATRTATCAGSLAVTVVDTKAEKEIEYKVQLAADGKTSVSVSPFLF
jgi:hypothetical protein